MKKSPIFLLVIVLTLPLFPVQAQTVSPAASITFDTSNFPQWAKDIRRWEIVAFGAFPFAMFTATFAMDTYRWGDANGFDFSDAGRRYAPWPLKSAGAVSMESRQYEMTIGIAAGLSMAIAMADLIIIQVKRHEARLRAESLPAGTAIILKKPWPDSPELDGSNETGGEDSGEAVDSNAASGVVVPENITPVP